jgi:hypothetical protein
MIFAHIGGVPVEEALLPLAGGASAALVLARGWLGSRVRCPFLPGERWIPGLRRISAQRAAEPPPNDRKAEST